MTQIRQKKSAYAVHIQVPMIQEWHVMSGW